MINKEFTMAEYIKENNLDVSPHDPVATRIIGKHLGDQGYFRRRCKRDGKFQIVWSKDPRPDYSELQQKLKELK